MQEQYRPSTVLYYDGAVAFGGALVVLATLFANVDRRFIQPRLISATPCLRLKYRFDDRDIALARRPALTYPERFRFARRIQRFPMLARKMGMYLFSMIALIANLPANLAVFRTLYRERPSLLHVNNSTTPLLFARLLNIPVVWHIHEVPTRPGLIDRYLMRSITRFIAISDYVAHAAVESGYPKHRIAVIHNPAPAISHVPRGAESLRARYNIPDDHLVIAHIGRLVRWKGQLEFIKAFETVVESFHRVTALVVGDDAENFASDYLAELRGYVECHKLKKHIRFTGHIGNILELMASVDVVVHSSIVPEPFGLVITEAMSVGTVVIAAQSGAPTEIIEHEVNGMLVDPRDQVSFSNTILTLVSNNEMRRTLSNHALDKVRKKYDVAIFATAVISLYEEVIGHMRL